METHAETKEAHTVSRIPRPVWIASAGGKDYQTGVVNLEHLIDSLEHTMPILWPREAATETLESADTTLLSEFIILSLPLNSLKASA